MKKIKTTYRNCGSAYAYYTKGLDGKLTLMECKDVLKGMDRVREHLIFIEKATQEKQKQIVKLKDDPKSKEEIERLTNEIQNSRDVEFEIEFTKEEIIAMITLFENISINRLTRTEKDLGKEREVPIDSNDLMFIFNFLESLKNEQQ